MKTVVTIEIKGEADDVEEALDELHEQVSLISSKSQAFVEIKSVEDSEGGSE